MRYTVRALGAAMTAVLAAGWLVGASGVAQAEGTEASGLYAPSSLVLTVGDGPDAETATVKRAVVLDCAPTPTGTHPTVNRTCKDIRSLGGDFTKLVERFYAEPGRPCTMIWDPIVVTADGVWEGKRVHWSHTFGNSCVKEAAQDQIFAF
ncbi:subtilase-type protease inhibitor [Streptomyces pathocidini]|uniref:Probable subtilase-type protease inhibitor n=1 Tax=Streptomyces pathocidini TaxID=1650571 RepID=A0ABW7UXC5_9ACTN|nr:subtilase-type protease inhibitor [Streptomyces pathocidini]